MKPLKEKELINCADDSYSRKTLLKIFEWRKEVFAKNEFLRDETPFTLSLCGLKLNFKPSSAFSTIETFQEIFIDNEHFKHPMFVPEKAKVILDIGANQGFYSLRASMINPKCKIIAYEPNPFEFEYTSLNLASNKHITSNIIAVNKAVSLKNESLKLEIIPEIGTIGGVSLKQPERKWLKNEFIKEIISEAITLDYVFESNSIQHLDLLKMDVEGSEIDILNNFNNFELIDKAIIEYHSQKGREELVSIMKCYGFNVDYEDYIPGNYYGDVYFSRISRTV